MIYPVHQFIWECFYGVKPNGMVVVNIDGHKMNNTICNLRLASLNMVMDDEDSYEKYDCICPRCTREK